MEIPNARPNYQQGEALEIETCQPINKTTDITHT
jgi:ribosomal protein S17